jgi:gliding motility-associated protein GldE
MVLFSAPVLRVLTNIFRPISRTLVSSTAYFEERLASKSSNPISTEDFEQAIEQTVGHTATREEVNIFKGILKFSAITARQIMRTRLDVTAVPDNMSFTDLQQVAIKVRYSRLPVYRGNLDTVVGVIHTKDLLPHAEKTDFDWHTLIRPAYIVHERKLIADLRYEFQEKRVHLAIVVDEFGGTSGIVTLEDIMEEIIGDIRDEFDEDTLNFKKIDDHNYIFEGKTLINDACRAMGLPSDVFDMVRGESDSVAGLILELLGKFPSVNETVEYGGYDLTVLEIDRMRIKKVKLTIGETTKEQDS